MKSFISVALLAGATQAWWDNGHLLTARRAYDLLSVENEAALNYANAALAPLKRHYPDITESEGNYPFVECATFADEIKGKGYSWQSGWHFIDQPYLIDGGSISDFPDFKPDEEDNVQALYALTDWLMETGDYKTTTYYQQIANAFSSEQDQKSFALRLIIHYVGDVHQPLHTTAAVSDTYPHGDAGGNYEHLPEYEDSGATNLHSVWDSVIYNYTGYATLPFSSADWAKNEATIQGIAEAYPVTGFETHDGNFQEWATEGYNNSVQYVYAGYTNGQPLTDEYMATAEGVAKESIMKGGRRLADLIVELYNANQPALFLQ